MLAFALLVCAALAAARPIETPVWTGYYGGQLNIVPYAYMNGGYVCQNCAPVSTFVELVGSASTLFVNISYSAGTSPACSVAAQGYAVYNVQPHSGGAYPYYYTGTLAVAAQMVPVCFYMGPNSAGSLNFVFTVDGKGSCPVPSQPASCTNAGAGAVTQVWSGVVAQSTLPTGTTTGTLGVQPFTPGPTGGVVCGKCPVIASKASFAWAPPQQATLVITAQAASGGGCTMPTTAYTFTSVVAYGAAYPGFFRAWYQSSAAQAIPVCFLYYKGVFAVVLDGQGTCPSPNVAPTCVQAGAGTVIQVFAGKYA